MTLAIVTDSTADLTAPRQRELDLRVIPLSVHIGSETFDDWTGITPKEMFRRVEQGGAAHPTTSQPSPERFREIYAQAFAEGADEILSLHIASGLSGTLGSATLAAKEVKGPVHLFDSKTTSVGLGALVTRASELRAEGAKGEVILAELARLRDALFLRMILPRLDYLHKGGRIGGAQAFVGGLLKLTPILTFKEGKVATTARARGLSRAMKTLFGELASYAQAHPGGIRVFPVFGTEDSEAKGPVLAEIGNLGEAVTLEASTTGGSVIGVYGGPGWFGLAAIPRG
ncbi:MAG: DegV family protein [Deinococcota bacterium]|jgi:DegV family protein with EDD domain|nr:DegV family protein [Deinococcota bacterium]